MDMDGVTKTNGRAWAARFHWALVYAPGRPACSFDSVRVVWYGRTGDADVPSTRPRFAFFASNAPTERLHACLYLCSPYHAAPHRWFTACLLYCNACPRVIMFTTAPPPVNTPAVRPALLLPSLQLPAPLRVLRHAPPILLAVV